MTPSPIAVAAVDVGSPASGKIGWAVSPPDQSRIVRGTDLDAFIDKVAGASERYPLAVGFEAPLFAPYRPVARSVLQARAGEGSRPWSAGAGAAVTTAALGVVPYVLRKLREAAPEAVAWLDAGRWPGAAGELLFFEAFVTAHTKGMDHADDAVIAVNAFRAGELITPRRSALDEIEVFSLIGAAMMRTGWTQDPRVLSEPCLVVKA